MTSYVLLHRASPLHLGVKALVQQAGSNGEWVTVRVHEIKDSFVVEQVHKGQRLIVEEVDPFDNRPAPQQLNPRPSR